VPLDGAVQNPFRIENHAVQRHEAT
jgi:hypothetical protein